MAEELIAKLSALCVQIPADEPDSEFIAKASHDESGAPESSDWGGHKMSTAPALYRDCLQDFFHANLTDDSLFFPPTPRCCHQPITTGEVRIFLTAALIKQHELKKIEFDSPDRAKCSNPIRSAFIRFGRHC